MTWNWQDIAALAIIGVAVVYVASLVCRSLWRRGTSGCGGGCFGCQQTETESTQVVNKIGTSKSLRDRP